MNQLKWTGTALCLLGIFLTSLNVYPLNILIGFIGSGLWAAAGYAQDDTPLCVVEIVATLFYAGGLAIYVFERITLWWMV